MCVFVYLHECMCTCMGACVWKTANEFGCSSGAPTFIQQGSFTGLDSSHRQDWGKPKVPPASTSPVLGYGCALHSTVFHMGSGHWTHRTEPSCQRPKDISKSFKSYVWSLKSAFSNTFLSIKTQHFSINIKNFVFLK